MLYTVGSEIKCTFQKSMFWDHQDNHVREKFDRSRKNARFLQKQKGKLKIECYK